MDTFTAGISYSTDGVTVPFLSRSIIALISGLMLTLSLKAGTLFRSLIPPDAARLLSFFILFSLSLYKLYDSLPASFKCSRSFTTTSISKKVNRRDVHILSVPEAILLSLTLSLDSISAGLSTGSPALLPAVLFLLSSAIHFAAISLGLWSGSLLVRKFSCSFAWLSAVLLFLLALMRLF